MDTIDSAAKIERTLSHGIASSSGREAGQLGLPLDHFRRWSRVGPFLLARDVQQALPLKAVATDADTVADGTPVRLHDIEKPFGRMNDDRAGSLGGAVKNDLAPKLQRQLFIGGIGNVAGLVADRHVLALRKSVRDRDGKGRQ